MAHVVRRLVIVASLAPIPSSGCESLESPRTSTSQQNRNFFPQRNRWIPDTGGGWAPIERMTPPRLTN
jgi:hypothetical protein